MSRLQCVKFSVASFACPEAQGRTRSCSALWASEQCPEDACRGDAREKRRGARAQSQRLCRVSSAPSQTAELQRRWRFATLLDQHDGDDDKLISSTRNYALRRVGCRIWETCFINAALQALARPLLSSRFYLETGTLAAQAADVALHAVRGLQVGCATCYISSRTPKPYALSTPRAGHAPAPCIFDGA